MSAIRTAFDRLRRQRRKALIPFVMGGDPSLQATGPLLLALQEGGADLIEIGIPFSDPLADGPTLQAASARALARGATPAKILSAVASVKRRLHVPIIALSYWNLLLQFGGTTGPAAVRAFITAAKHSGLAGVIVPDLPVEAASALRAAEEADGFSMVLLAAPTSPAERLRAIARASQGFIYYVSVTGTTGARRRLPPALAHGIRQLRLLTTKPICVGFGISTPSQAVGVARLADGVIVGSALVAALHEGGPRRAAHTARVFLRRFRNAL